MGAATPLLRPSRNKDAYGDQEPLLPNNPIVFCNEAFQKLTVDAQDGVIGRNCRFLKRPDTDKSASALMHYLSISTRVRRICRLIVRFPSRVSKSSDEVQAHQQWGRRFDPAQGKPQPTTPVWKSFDDCWKSHSSDFQARTDLRATWTLSGGLHVRCGRAKITIWAESITEARKQAIIEADYRVALRGGKQSARSRKVEAVR